MEDRKEVSRAARESRREAMKKMAYAAPFVVSLAASPAFASTGSGKPCGPRGSSSPRSRPNRRFVTN